MFRQTSRLLASSTLIACAITAQCLAQDDTLKIIHAGHVLTIPGQPFQIEQSIYVRDGVIERIEAGYATLEGAEIIDLTDQWVMPGFIDSHVHLTSELNPNGRLMTVTDSSADRAIDGAKFARATLMAGFTTVQDVGGSLDAVTALRDGINAGDIPGPRMRVSGPAVTPTGGHGDINGYSSEVMDLLTSRAACNGAADCRRAVRELVRGGADVIKITATGGVLSNTAAGVEQQFFDDELASIVEAAHMMGRQVTAHAHGVTGINSFLEAGGNSIEHGTYLDRESIRLFKRNNAYLIPTVLAGVTVAEMAETAAWMTPAQRDKSRQVGPQMIDMARRAHEGGVAIAFGTDSGVSRHGLNAREFELLVEAGLTPMEAIVSATINAANHLELSAQIGTLETGKSADIVAVDGDPLADIRQLQDMDFVMARGIVYRND